MNTNKIILLIALGLILLAVYNYKPQAVSIEIGQTARLFDIELIDGKKWGLEEQKGMPVVIFFWAQWCPCSHNSMPFMEQAYKDYGPKGVRFIGIGIQDTQSELKKFIVQERPSFQMAFDLKSKVANLYGIVTTPTTLFITSDGKIGGKYVGQIKTYQTLSGPLNKLL
ncbi:MAG: TlpA family protein disulfide reductase [Nitrospirae bacterium]|nr:TlpA family protein disulfide reductase [Nitrospirota bacterium]